MIFTPYVPASTIAPYIESIFHFKDFVPDHSMERVVPTGHVFIIFELDGFERNTFDNESLQPNASFSKVWVSGMHRNHISISAHAQSEMFVIQFRPFGGHPFFHQTMETYAEQVLPAENVFGKIILSLRDAMVEVDTPRAKFALAEQWLLQVFKPKLTPSAELVSFVDALQKEPVAHLNALIEGYDKSQKHLIDQFKKHLGLTPKYFQRILRFNEILRKVKEEEKVSWVEIAYHCGYSDQSHFIKEFRHFSGFNPSEFIKQEFDKEEPNFFALDR